MSVLPPELRLSLKATSAVLRGRTPRQLVIQYTDSCNAHCPQCGMRVENSFARSRLEYEFTRRVLETAAEQGTMSVSLTGGEPMLFADQVFSLLHYARSLGIRYTRTGTNGFVFQRFESPDFDNRVAKLAARIRGTRIHTFWISLDSADAAIHEAARGLPGVIAGVRRALPILRDYGVFPAVNLGINRRMGSQEIEPMWSRTIFARQTRQALRDFYRAAIELGFTTANVCYPMDFRSDGPESAYRATSSDPVVSFSSEERAVLFRVIAEVTEEFRPLIRVFSPISSLSALSRQHAGHPGEVPGCRGGVDFFYISAADRLMYPCGFRGGEPLGDPTLRASWDTENRPQCTSCDWECFRDPSCITSPLSSFIRRPDIALRWVGTEQARVLGRDWRYYRASDFFSCTRPPSPHKLSRFR